MKLPVNPGLSREGKIALIPSSLLQDWITYGEMLQAKDLGSRIEDLGPPTNDQRPTTNDQRPTTNDLRPTTNDP